jgi:hypothetical protein
MQGFIIGFIFGFGLKYALCKYSDNCKCPQCSIKWMSKK